ncbi:MAG: DUF2141 domain-containing protein [Chitinophagaceae bacterium]|nr:DUF2141 domain-containing protein [Chitinophagaceae bacterium]
MKTVFLSILLSLLALAGFSFMRVPEEGIKVSVTNLRNNNGHVLISLFREGSGYPDEPEKAIRKGRVIIKDNKAWIIFTGIPAGSYAVAILHDENDDQKMNKNGLGLPKEGYGFSNNVMGAFGPPSYSRASFKFNSTSLAQITIKTRY